MTDLRALAEGASDEPHNCRVSPCPLCKFNRAFNRAANPQAILALLDERDELREDVLAAAGELLVDMADAPPGSLVARLLVANRLMHRERDALTMERETANVERVRYLGEIKALAAEVERLKAGEWSESSWRASYLKASAEIERLEEHCGACHVCRIAEPPEDFDRTPVAGDVVKAHVRLCSTGIKDSGRRVLARAYGVSDQGQLAVSTFMADLADLLRKEDYEACKRILETAEFGQLDVAQILGMLSVLEGVEHLEEAWSSYLERVKAWVKATCPDRESQLLEGYI